MVHFSGKARKMNHLSSSCERSERENQRLGFMYGFKVIFVKSV
ncbi:MAG: hypothetical protein U5L45_07175 [Saprospiraceae bacterium]|nr:hypothetical protein [Saprospiraceae bacterium]